MSSLLIETLLPLSCVFTRSLLNIVDRHMLGIKKLNIHLQNCFNVTSALLIGCLISTYFCSFNEIISVILQPYCFISAVVMHLVSYAFSLSFKHSSVREVLVTAKVADLIITPAICFCLTYFFWQSDLNAHVLKPTTYLIGFCALALLFVGMKDIDFLWHPRSLFLIMSISLQILFTMVAKQNNTVILSLKEGWILSIGMLIWRSIFSLVPALICVLQTRPGLIYQKISFRLIVSIFMRAAMMILAYVTFVFSIELNKPLIVFPILNSSLLIATFLAKFILKEKPSFYEVAALIGMTSLPLID
ncbi:MAG: hypothetical protein H0X29_02480 [Parachlamydiaceae bacterium]|nr:hypothetical protein [Parachlamydiaceae bacterium]